MAKQKTKATHKIGNCKKRGEWVELKFMAEMAERDLSASKPLGDSESFDVVVGHPGKFVAVQVKSTLSRDRTGYVCKVSGSNYTYAAGAFDFLVAYVIPENVWYIIPAELIYGKASIALYPNTADAKYEKYREAWHLLREAVGTKEVVAVEIPKAEESTPPNRMEARMIASFNFVRRHWER